MRIGLTWLLRSRVEQADDATLLKWSERVLTAETLNEVLH